MQVVADALVEGFKDKIRGALNFAQFIKDIIKHDELKLLGSSIGLSIISGILDVFKNNPYISLLKLFGAFPKDINGRGETQNKHNPSFIGPTQPTPDTTGLFDHITNFSEEYLEEKVLMIYKKH